MDLLTEATVTLLNYCRDEKWAGYDPYDALNSSLMKGIPGFQNRVPRLALTQIVKRLPINFRKLLRVPKSENPKGTALFCSTLTKLVGLGLGQESEIKSLADRLMALRSSDNKRFCWGYNFDWQTRTYLVPRGTPNIICTTFGGNALLDAYDALGDPLYLEAALSAGHFLLEGLSRTTIGDTQCFSYTPLDKSQIHNANLLGAAFLTRIHGYSPTPEFVKPVEACTRFSVERQALDGSWPYGETTRQRWIDSFHTGYNLVALKQIQAGFPQLALNPCIEKGFKFFFDHFLSAEGFVKYFHNKAYPIDIHALAYGIVTLVEFQHLEPKALSEAERICDWTIRNMRSEEDGTFYFQKWPLFTNRIAYIRWSQAWMLLAMATLLEARAGSKMRKSQRRYSRETIFTA